MYEQELFRFLSKEISYLNMSSLQYAPKTSYRLSDCFAPERDLALLLEGLVTLGIGQDIECFECFEKYK